MNKTSKTILKKNPNFYRDIAKKVKNRNTFATRGSEAARAAGAKGTETKRRRKQENGVQDILQSK